MLSDDLLHRLRARAADPATRTDSYTPPQGRSFFGGAFQTRTINLDGSPVADPAPLPAPATDTDIATAETRLGFSFPIDLAQLYRSVANGGFGPGDGLAPLDAMTDRYLAFRAEPMGPEGEPWPANLLPITLTEPGADCLDLDTGGIVFWDEESLADIPWPNSFKPAADNLGAWLEDWLASPPLADQVTDTIDEGLRENMRQTLAHWRAMTPEQRAEYGLSEDGWEEQLFGHLGIDLKGL